MGYHFQLIFDAVILYYLAWCRYHFVVNWFPLSNLYSPLTNPQYFRTMLLVIKVQVRVDLGGSSFWIHTVG